MLGVLGGPGKRESWPCEGKGCAGPQLSERVQLRTTGVRRAGEGMGETPRPRPGLPRGPPRQAFIPFRQGRQGGGRSRVRSLCGGRAPLKPPCPGCGPPARPFFKTSPRPLFSLASGDIARREFRGTTPEPQAGSRCPGQMGLLLGGQPHSQTPTPHTARGIEPRAGRADTPTIRPSPMVRLAWQLPVLSALSQPRNPLSWARPSPARGQIRGEKPQARKEPGATAASASL